MGKFEEWFKKEYYQNGNPIGAIPIFGNSLDFEEPCRQAFDAGVLAFSEEVTTYLKSDDAEKEVYERIKPYFEKLALETRLQTAKEIVAYIESNSSSLHSAGDVWVLARWIEKKYLNNTPKSAKA